MANFKTGREGLAYAASKSKSAGKFTPTFKFEAGKTKYIQFLTPLDETPTVLFHNFIIVGEREDGNPKYATFISRTDDALDGAGGYDPLIERYSRLGAGYGSMPSAKTIGLAVELTPVFEPGAGGKRRLSGFDLETREFENKEGETITVPAVGLVVQAYSNFWGHVEVNDDNEPIENVVFAVTRTGTDTSTSYTFVKAGDALDVEEDLKEFFEEFDFSALLDEWSDEGRIRELVGGLPDDFVVDTYGLKNAKAKKNRSKSGANSSRSRKEPEEETEDETEVARPRARASRFAALKTEIG